MPPGPAKDEVLRTVAWADYYATQSAQYAHYYNNQKQNQTAAIPKQSLSQPPPPPSALNLPTPPVSSKPTQIKNKAFLLCKDRRAKGSHYFSFHGVSNCIILFSMGYHK